MGTEAEIHTFLMIRATMSMVFALSFAWGCRYYRRNQEYGVATLMAVASMIFIALTLKVH